jgi:cellulose synthase/poly-beta-1,6-N-acetylglucosamine synthase-like glycosyltransferase/peptidoglycan/xylan/chitin deacetylase (PgdA/CDA1 family)/peptidoglycan/LPS O-acetylase OafA/YrhL
VRLPWVFAGIAVALLSVMLVIAGLATAQVGNDASAHERVGTASVPSSVVTGGSVVDATRSPVASVAPKAMTIALTFDDGPDPTWTPQILSILDKHRVPGTFFVVGSMGARYPDLLRRIHDSGSELGLHTFTHPDLVDVSQWRMDRELDETQMVVAGAAGVTTNLFRPPYSSSVSAIDDLGYGTVLAAGGRGYVSVFTDLDSEDWQRPGIDAIVRNSTPESGQGAVVLMHDAGGDRSQTVAALDRLIPQLQQRGYRFTTVTGAVGMAPADQPATGDDRLIGAVLLHTIDISLAVVATLQWILLVVGVLVILRLVLMLIYARRHARRRRAPGWGWGPPVTEPVSVIMPVFNEVTNIEVAVRSILASDHPHEIVVVDDGSTDGTADLIESLHLPGVAVIRQPNGGKASALNTGIAHARHDLIVMVDGDTVFEPDTMRRLVQPFADPGMGAVSGNVKIANRDTFLTRLQHIEYVIGFNVDRRMHDLTGSICTIPGAAGAFRRAALLAAGGVSDQTLAEDTDLTIAIGRLGWRMAYVDDAVAWTEAPETLRQLWQQRYRWTYGTMQSVWKHRRAIFRRDSGRLGWFGLVHVIAFQIVLPVTAPVIDVFFVYGLFFFDPGTTLVLWLSVMLLQSAGAAYAFHLDRESKSALWLMPMQQLVYRQLMYVVLAQSLAAALSGIRVRWQRMRRNGALDAMVRRAETHSQPMPSPAMSVTAVTPTARGADDLGSVATPRADTEVPRARAPAPPGGRDRWMDSLRAIALVRVVLYHVTGWGWLSIVFPAMGVMFALGGSLMAGSLGRTPAVDVIGHRIRRLLPPLWLLGLVVVPLMLVNGWLRETGDQAFSWAEMLLWVFPILDPPGSVWGADFTVVLWYVRTYLWFVLLSPVLLMAFRRRPVVTVLAPLVFVALDTLAGSPVGDSGSVGQGIVDFCTFGACWILGFAHRDGMLRRMRPAVLIGLFVAAVGLGGWWTAGHPLPDGTFDLNELPLGQALISVGAVLLFLRVSPDLAWLDRIPVLGRLVAVVNARAVTIYLWHNLAIDLAYPVNDWLGWPSLTAQIGTTVVLVALAVFAFGWVEDVAGRRPLRLLPGGRRRDSRPPGRRLGSPRAEAAPPVRDLGGTRSRS